MVAVKICGMKDQDNIRAVAAYRPEYMGFICWPGSPRFVGVGFAQLPQLDSIKRVGVFVNQKIEEILDWSVRLSFSVIQLHGDEDSAYCVTLRKQLPNAEIWKSFSISNELPVEKMSSYTSVIDRILLDTKSEKRGGSGESFSWSMLEGQNFERPIVLSGGIGLENLKRALELCTKVPAISVIDLNSKLESAVGFKNISLVKQLFDLV